MWPLNQWLLPSLLKRGIQASASEENQSMARPLSSALPPALKEKASSQGCGAPGRRIWAILHDSGLTCGTARRPLVKIRFQTSIQPHDAMSGQTENGLQPPESTLQAFNSSHCEKTPCLTGHLAAYSDFKSDEKLGLFY